MKDLENKLSGIIYLNEQTKIKNFNIKWKWNYETGTTEEEIKKNDLIDTNEATTIEKYILNIIVTATQNINDKI